MRKVYEFIGGRKQTDKYLAVLLVSLAATRMETSFLEFSGIIAAILIGGAFATAWEDRGKRDA